MTLTNLIVHFFLILGCVCGFSGLRQMKSSRIVLTPLQVSTDSIPTTASDAAAAARAEGTMMKSPAFKILDFIMSIPIVHGK